jgi:hypothetical protein
MSSVTALLLAVAAQAGTGDGLRPITKADGVIAVFRHGAGFGAAELKVVVVAWADGHVVWSEDQQSGGTPYRSGAVPPERVMAALRRLERDGALADKRLGQANVGPDSQFTSIFVKKEALQLRMDSWHELSEERGGVAASYGLTALPEGQTRLGFLRKEPADYLYYRLAWAEIRLLAASLIPTDGKPTDARPAMEAGILSWREGPRK